MYISAGRACIYNIYTEGREVHFTDVAELNWLFIVITVLILKNVSCAKWQIQLCCIYIYGSNPDIESSKVLQGILSFGSERKKTVPAPWISCFDRLGLLVVNNWSAEVIVVAECNSEQSDRPADRSGRVSLWFPGIASHSDKWLALISDRIWFLQAAESGNARGWISSGSSQSLPGKIIVGFQANCLMIPQCTSRSGCCSGVSFL